jgi:hypothetical protein
MRGPSVAQSVTPVCDGFAFFKFKCSTPAIGHGSEARELRSSRQQTNGKQKHEAAKQKPLRDAGAGLLFLTSHLLEASYLRPLRRSAIDR